MEWLSERLTVRVTGRYYARIQAIARESGVKPSEIAREAILGYIKEHDNRLQLEAARKERDRRFWEQKDRERRFREQQVALPL
jgi:predicted transcriptional regulator